MGLASQLLAPGRDKEENDMPRQLPQAWRDGDVPEIERKNNDSITQVREYELITPLFGGGVEPGVADPITVVRATEVRGHLRFWWRATRGGQCGGSLEQMKAAEDAIWGSSTRFDGNGILQGGPSKVSLEVDVVDRGFPFNSGEAYSVGHFRSSYSYVAFPLQDSGRTLVDGVRFKIKLTYPSTLQADIEAAVRVWELFGGIGARTRRGFGAIKRLHVPRSYYPPANLLEAREWIVSLINDLSADGNWDADVPHLEACTSLVVTPLTSSPLDSWKRLFTNLKRFRQQRPLISRWYTDRRTGVRRQRPMPGRNHWPEPDEIRRRTGDRAAYIDDDGNERDHTRDVNDIPAFPRAAFGLPIQFEFKSTDQRNGDPRGKNLLRGVKTRRNGDTQYYERLASPIILRPIPCAQGYLGLVVRLAGVNVPPELEVDVEKGHKRNVRWELSTEEAGSIPEFDESGNSYCVTRRGK
jgi:CRISPR-associated protein Cmr1